MELQPCPFCGGEPTAYKDNFKNVAISCNKCGAMIGITLECGEELVNGWTATFETPEKAVESWNDRTISIGDAICVLRNYFVERLLNGTDCANEILKTYNWTLQDGRAVELDLRVMIK